MMEIGEVVALRAQYLTNLAIAEFEVSMSLFDFQSVTGLKVLFSFITLNIFPQFLTSLSFLCFFLAPSLCSRSVRTPTSISSAGHAKESSYGGVSVQLPLSG